MSPSALSPAWRWLVFAAAWVAVLVASPLIRWPPVLRLGVLLVPTLTLAVAMARPWRWSAAEWATLDRWRPSNRAAACAAVAAGFVLFWLVLTRFQSGEINAVDFTVYFDRPCFQTIHGKALFVETADVPGFSWRSELAVHAFWIMPAIAQLYRLHATPLWLLGLSAVAVVAGALYVFRIVRYTTRSTILAAAASVAFLLNDNTARALNYGFHPEILYAWFIPWMLDAGLRGARRSFAVAVLACVLVKEDACMPLFAASVALALDRDKAFTLRDRVFFLALPTIVGLANLAVYYGYVLPALVPDGRPTYASFWANYGSTPLAALLEMALHPGRVLAGAGSSGFFSSVLPPFLFLPIIGWRWSIGIVPIVLLYGASANEQLRAFSLYYAVVLVPFLIVAATMGARTVAERFLDGARASAAGGALVVAGAVLVGASHAGYSVRPWKAEMADVPAAIAQLASERTILVQSGLYPHAGYDGRVQLLTPQTLSAPAYAGSAILLAPGVSGYPFDRDHIAALARLPSAGNVPGRLIAVRLDAR